ncbi:hypothetical protein BJ508DRAFT_90538 [Ascobolus immersus RN42]|uniref:Uncharacterized protein n=1 Tax=Ascobolus immersus RN42 TaxID=1160509 RepID=A0A3N4IL04_ASCIM|nr:hypothetical protein BJ508DRAFT_90538 [Ascobolus immersus RN42]
MEESPVVQAHAHIAKAQRILGLNNPPTGQDLLDAASEYSSASALLEAAVNSTRDLEVRRTLLLMASDSKKRSSALTSIATRPGPIPQSRPPSPPTLATPPSLSTQTRTPTLASNLASARGIPSRTSKSYNPQASTPPLGNTEHHDPEPFLASLDALLRMLPTPLALPLGFAGLPLDSSPANLEGLVPKSTIRPILPSGPLSPPLTTTGQESFYVVPTTGMSAPYSEIARRGLSTSSTGTNKTKEELEYENKALRELVAEVAKIDYKSRAEKAEKEVEKWVTRWEKLREGAKLRKKEKGEGSQTG